MFIILLEIKNIHIHQLLIFGFHQKGKEVVEVIQEYLVLQEMRIWGIHYL
jgi:hypothetical protein